MTIRGKTILFGFALEALALMCISTAVGQGSLLLVGGGSEDYSDWSDAPYRWLVNHAPNRKILVLNYADTTDFFSGYFPWLSPCTVANLAITSSSQANDSAVYRRILEYDGIFLRGGDQWQYVNLWRHTLTEQAIREIYRRGGVIGGTSAGSMILGDVVYDARLASTDPRIALRNPLGSSITLTDDFLALLPDAIVDTHFFERGRLGRLPAFLAQYKQSSGRNITGIGVEYGTALAIGPDGIGEVMGSGTVTILRPGPKTQYILEANKPLSVKNIGFDQLTSGETVNLSAGKASPSASAIPYGAGPFSSPAGTIVLDGSGTSSNWAAAGGSLQKLQGALAQATDTIGIISPAAAQGLAAAVGSALTSWGTPCRFLWIGESARNDTAFATAISLCGGFVLVGNSPDSLSRFLDSSSLAEDLFHNQLDRGKPVALLGDDAGLAGESGVGQMYRSIYGAYYGYMRHVGGAQVLKGIQPVARLYEQYDYIDNRASSVFWSMAEEHLPYGLLLDQGAHVTVSAGQLRVFGTTPAVLIDARTAIWSSVPEWHDPGKANPRQLGGILGATMHVLREGDLFDLIAPNGVEERNGQAGLAQTFVLEQNYPNPFNPSTEIRYTIHGRQSTSVRVFDILGREVAVIVDEVKEPGRYSVTWDAAGMASGVYFCRLSSGGNTTVRRMLLLR